MPELDSIKTNSPINHKTAENAVLDQRPLTYNVETDYLEKFLKKFGSPLDHALLTVFSESQDQAFRNIRKNERFNLGDYQSAFSLSEKKDPNKQYFEADFGYPQYMEAEKTKREIDQLQNELQRFPRKKTLEGRKKTGADKKSRISPKLKNLQRKYFSQVIGLKAIRQINYSDIREKTDLATENPPSTINLKLPPVLNKAIPVITAASLISGSPNTNLNTFPNIEESRSVQNITQQNEKRSQDSMIEIFSITSSPASQEQEREQFQNELYIHTRKLIDAINHGRNIPENRKNTAVIALGIMGSERNETDGNLLIAITAKEGKISWDFIVPFTRDLVATIDDKSNPPFPKIKFLYKERGPERYRKEMSKVAGQEASLSIINMQSLPKLIDYLFPKGMPIDIPIDTKTIGGTKIPKGNHRLDGKTVLAYMAERQSFGVGKNPPYPGPNDEELVGDQARTQKGVDILKNFLEAILKNPFPRVEISLTAPPRISPPPIIRLLEVISKGDDMGIVELKDSNLQNAAQELQNIEPYSLLYILIDSLTNKNKLEFNFHSLPNKTKTAEIDPNDRSYHGHSAVMSTKKGPLGPGNPRYYQQIQEIISNILND